MKYLRLETEQGAMILNVDFPLRLETVLGDKTTYLHYFMSLMRTLHTVCVCVCVY